MESGSEDTIMSWMTGAQTQSKHMDETEPRKRRLRRRLHVGSFNIIQILYLVQQPKLIILHMIFVFTSLDVTALKRKKEKPFSCLMEEHFQGHEELVLPKTVQQVDPKIYKYMDPHVDDYTTTTLCKLNTKK
ncbi:unnamed protein product [Vicia faba]|uniref:Uncharacterized protein n=1 Tax=Vicia faba TaxID=3906 RepID=A0AAV0ZMH5_VICFA|nr:unnamed protein product [Vicia faba]